MIIGLIIILLLTFILPFTSKRIENNLEPFLFIMGITSVIVTGIISKELVLNILENKFLYMITAAVFMAGSLFKILKEQITLGVNYILKYISVKLFVFLVIIVLGFLSSVITAIIASLILVEIINILPLKRNVKIEICIIACFSIGLGATLTPLGEPISTIIVSKLHVGFWYIFDLLGPLILPGIIMFGIIGVWVTGEKRFDLLYKFNKKDENNIEKEIDEVLSAENFEVDEDTFVGIIHRTIKIFIFVIALDLLGTGFKPLVDKYVINFNITFLYWGNMVSAILDNSTLAAAEISPKMNVNQITSIMMGLLISGGMLIPGNIPNIVSANKLKIKSSEWIKLGVPLGLVTLFIYYILLFHIL